MQARGPLMVEHRLIEKMIAVIRSELDDAHQTGSIDLYIVDTTIDFFRFYADRTHHGKEEEILFRDLASLPLKDADAALMRELMADHAYVRATTEALVKGGQHLHDGAQGALDEVSASLQALVDFYPQHIAKEDHGFFPAMQTYLDTAREQALLAEFAEFDRQIIHQRYKLVVEEARARLHPLD